MTARQGLGRRGEQLAAAYLERHGYRIVARNVRVPPYGEIDIVAEHDSLLVLCEVRIRRSAAYGGPLVSVTPAKQRRMLRTAQAYLAALGDDAATARLDVIGISLDRQGRLVSIAHIPNAVEAEYE